MTADGQVTWHPGVERFDHRTVRSTALGYDRDRLLPGALLPGTADADLLSAVMRCDELVIAFDGKLGDSLLAFAAVTAIRDALRIIQPQHCIPQRRLGRHAALYPPGPAPTATSPRHRIVIGDAPGIGAFTLRSTDYLLECRPEEPACRSTPRHLYCALPQRYYLAIEERLGIRLPGEPPFLPALTSGTTAAPSRVAVTAPLRLAAITATSNPDRKDFGAHRFHETAQHIARRTGDRFRLVLVFGHGAEPAHLHSGTHDVEVQCVENAGPTDLHDLFADCDLVLGNDTGLTHLAAMVRPEGRPGPEVIGVYARHSHSKWRTGLAHHHALATGFSRRMHRYDLCPVRDRIDDTHPGTHAELSAITPWHLANAALRVLAKPRS